LKIILQALREIWLQRQLVKRLLKRDFIERYRGSYFGLLWSFFVPLLSLLVFTLFFGVIFQSRWGREGEESIAQFAVILFVGMTIYNFIAECINRSPSLILSRQNYVKNVVFPLEILPTVLAASAAVNLGIGIMVILLLQIVITHTIQWTSILFPIVVIPLFLMGLGVSWFLSSLGVYVRDTQHVVVPLAQLLMFLSPVFYPLSVLPDALRPWFALNPLAVVMEQARAVLLFGHLPVWALYFKTLGFATVVACLGAYWFMRTRKGFADVI
jgi:lipopolysaccharide transport system permease protein